MRRSLSPSIHHRYPLLSPAPDAATAIPLSKTDQRPTARCRHRYLLHPAPPTSFKHWTCQFVHRLPLNGRATLPLSRFGFDAAPFSMQHTGCSSIDLSPLYSSSQTLCLTLPLAPLLQHRTSWLPPPVSLGNQPIAMLIG